MQINLFAACFYSFALDHCLLYSIPYYIRGKIKRCSLVSRGCVPHLVGAFLISWVQPGISWVQSGISWGAFLISWVPAAYIQTDPGRRAGGSHLRAAALVRLNGDCRVSVELGISLIINYLSSPLGRKKQKAISRNTLNTDNLEGI